MPPHQTNITSETGRDAAGFGLDLSIAWMKDAMDQTLTAARPDASIAALRDGLLEKHTAGAPAAPTRSVFSLLDRYWRAFQESRRLRRLSAGLRDLNERQLMDIGLTPGDVDRIAAQRAIERLRDTTTYFWLSRGVM